MDKSGIQQITDRLLSLTSEETISKHSLSEYNKEVDETSTACTQELLKYLTANDTKKTAEKGNGKRKGPRRARANRTLAPLRQQANKPHKGHPHTRSSKESPGIKHPQERKPHRTHRAGLQTKKKAPSNQGRRQSRLPKTVKPRLPFAASPAHSKDMTSSTTPKEKSKICKTRKGLQSGPLEPASRISNIAEAEKPQEDAGNSEGYSTENYEDDFEESIDEGSGVVHDLVSPVHTEELSQGVAAVPGSVEAIKDEGLKVGGNTLVNEVATSEPTSIPLTEEDKAIMRGNWEPIDMEKPDAIAGDSYNPQETPAMAQSSDEDSVSYASEDFETTGNYSPVRSHHVEEAETSMDRQVREQNVTSPVPFLPEITPHSSHEETTKLSINDTAKRTIPRQGTQASGSSTSTGDFESLLQEFEGVSYGGNPTQVEAN